MKSKFNFKIIYENGDEIDLHEKGLWVELFRISSATSQYITQKIEGRDGLVYLGSSKNERTVNASIQINGYDPEDFDLFRDEVFYILRPGEEIKIVRDMQKGKMLTCVVDSDFDIDYLTCEDGEFQVNFTTFDTHFKSIGTTQDIQLNGIDVDSELWGFGMGLLANEDSQKYTHTGTSFRIYNAGNVPIHPFEQELKITISNVAGSTSYFELKNETNGSLFRVNEGVTNSQTIILDGANITSNGLQYLRKTNKGFIELDPGWNDFKITGATSAKVQFDFRFYYL